MTTMPKLRISPEEARIRAIRGQIANKSEVLYGKKLTGKTFGRMFGLEEKTANNRRKDPDKTLVKELLHYFNTVEASDDEILAWFGR